MNSAEFAEAHESIIIHCVMEGMSFDEYVSHCDSLIDGGLTTEDLLTRSEYKAKFA